jgi:hypothetical protein
MKKRILGLTAAIFSLAALPVSAFDWSIVARVSVVEATYMPGYISFRIDKAAGTCAVGTHLIWNAQGATEATRIANANAVYAGLLSALHTNREVTLFGVNSGCSVQYIHFN